MSIRVTVTETRMSYTEKIHTGKGNNENRWLILVFYLLASSNVGFLIVTTAPIATQMRKVE